MLGTNPTTWITSLNDNGINKPTKNKSSKRVKTTQLYYLQETHFEYNHTGILKVKEWEIYTMLALNKKKKSQNSYTDFRQSQLQNREYYQGQRGILYEDKHINFQKTIKSPKHVYT